MARLGIDKDFLKEFAKLEKAVQDRVTEVFTKFEHATHAGLHLEKINNSRDDRIRTIRITKFWRGVVLSPKSGDSYTLLKVLPHDDAIAWAQRRSASVNRATGRIEIRDSVAIESAVPALSQIAEKAPRRLFEHIKDSDLRRLGVDTETLAFARALTDPVQLDASKSFLPGNQWDVLYGLAAGLTPEEVWAEVGAIAAPEEIDTNDLDAAIKRSSDRVVFVDGPEELLALFEHPFALWRVFLHPLQRSIVEGPYRGPARVTGGPGTGKTVVALHRAYQLAKRDDGPVLITTFTSTLSGSLQAGIKLLADGPDILERIEIRHVDQLANRVFREHHGSQPILQADQERELWRAICERLQVQFSPAFLVEEWRQVVLAQQIEDAGQYLAAKRTGRGRRLGSRQKANVWQAIWEFETELRKRGLWTHETICVEAARLLHEQTQKPYRHVVVDEAQDLSPWQWRLLRAAVPPLGDDIFIAGDTHQRIYQNRVSLREVGVAITGRSQRLDINYRTTAEILAWSLGLVRGERVDDMDGGLDSIAGCRSELHGMPPALKGFSTLDAELDHLQRVLKEWLDAGVAPDEIGVAARSNRLVNDIIGALSKYALPVRNLASSPTESAISVGTMHRMKGLEFRCLAVVGVNAYSVPPPNTITPVEDDKATHDHDLQRERCLLFVACTRAREQLSVTWHGDPSPFLDPVRHRPLPKG